MVIRRQRILGTFRRADLVGQVRDENKNARGEAHKKRKGSKSHLLPFAKFLGLA